jgi:uncharacterized membrane protein YsdA (DUF1294 family)
LATALLDHEWTLLAGWVGVTSLLGLVAMGIDKLQAVGGRERVRERTLWLIALLGGFPGIFIGGTLFHHKTSKAEFWAPVLISAILWLAILFYLRPHLF